jgi:hypothetical protein
MQQVKCGDIRIAVDAALVRDEMKANVIAQKAQSAYKDTDWGLWSQFGFLCSSVRKSSGLPFNPTTLHEAPDAEVVKAYEAFLDLTKPIKDAWSKAVKTANAPAKGELAPEVSDDDDLNW